MKFWFYLSKTFSEVSLVISSAFLGALVGSQGLGVPLGEFGWWAVAIIIVSIAIRIFAESQIRN